MNKKLMIGLILTVFALIVSATAALAVSASKNYYGLTKVTYTARIINQGDCCWNGGYTDITTSPSRSMDTFGLSVWTTYITCDGSPMYDTWISYIVKSYPWLYQHNVSLVSDGMARTKKGCPKEKQVRRLVNYTQHYWQDSGKPGSGGTLSAILIQ